MTNEQITPGMRFEKGGALLEVVKPNPSIPGDWFCRCVTCDTGLWSYDPRDILINAKNNDVHRG